jgi:hypothetical protein
MATIYCGKGKDKEEKLTYYGWSQGVARMELNE